MVIVKIGTGTLEREVEIVNEKGTWESGIYKIFNAHFLEGNKRSPEPHDTTSPDYLGDIDISKEEMTWVYQGDKLLEDEAKQVAQFIFDYQPPDGVY